MPFDHDNHAAWPVELQVQIFIANQLERIADALEAKGAGDTALQGDVTASPQPHAPACSSCDDKGYTAVFEGLPVWCTCPRGAQYATEGRRAVYNDGKVV